MALFLEIMFSRLLIVFFFAATLPVSATHLIGGEIFYDCLGNNQYRITLKIYRDCGPSNTQGTGFDQNAVIAIYDASKNLVNKLQPSLLTVQGISPNAVNPCLSSQISTSVCYEEGIYQTIVTLPPIAGGYDIVYQRCCRNPSTTNIINPSEYGATYWAHIPDPQLATCNSSPRFNNLLPVAMCAGIGVYINNSATDPDGDELVYEFYRPLHGGGNNTFILGGPNSPAPNPPTPPNFSTVVWKVGYSDTYQIPSNPAMQINPQNGYITGTPSQSGLYVIGVRVKEYRNGQLLSMNSRDFQVSIIANSNLCNPTTISKIKPQTDFCIGKTVQFFHECINTGTFHWDFGDSNTATDTSSFPNPTYTYADTGTYTVMLIANPGWGCADTSYETFIVKPELEAIFNTPASQCITDNLLEFSTHTYYDSVFWQFGTNASPATANTFLVPNVSFDEPGFYPVTLTAYKYNCSDTYTDTVRVYPHPVPEFDFPTGLACQPYWAYFKNLSQSWTNMLYFWDFGDGGTSSLPNPTHLYTDTGNFTVSLTVITTSGCIDTVTMTKENCIQVFPRPNSNFSVTPDEQSIFHPDFKYFNYSSGQISCAWHMGDGTVINDCSDQQYSYADSGFFPVSMITLNEHGCYDTLTRIVRVNPEFVFFIPNAFTPDADGLNEFFFPKMMGIRTFEFYIFDRWGEVIFKTQDQNQGWNGKAQNGAIMPVGVYPYLVKITDVFDKFHEYVGHVTIVR